MWGRHTKIDHLNFSSLQSSPDNSLSKKSREKVCFHASAAEKKQDAEILKAVVKWNFHFAASFISNLDRDIKLRPDVESNLSSYT